VKKYRISLTLTADEFMRVFPSICGNGQLDVEEVADRTEAPNAVPAPKATRKRASKVNDTILDRLRKGPAEAAALKQTLADADLSPNSLSTGLAILQKDGRIRRADDGSYELAA
jgi:predicted Rossmann fold nucleotide-binding protein DprA/Smf involved in DNA uptake